jgi:hypothetical protein
MLDTIEKPGKASAKKAPAKEETTTLSITAPNIQTAQFTIRGTAPLVIAAFSAKAQNAIKKKHEAGSTAKTRQKRDARNFSEDVRQALHISTEGWHGFNATGLKLALVSACRTVSYKMTLAKLGIFVQADGSDAVTGVPLIRIQSPAPYEENIGPARNANGGFDLRARPMWREWHMDVRIAFDADMFTLSDIANLLLRAGLQVGIGEGRADSRSSCGTGWGSFTVEATDAA